MNTIKISEAAKYLDVHPDTIRNWELMGYITPIKTLGGHRRYLKSDIDKLKYQINQNKIIAQHGMFSDITEAYGRKGKYLHWKQFVESHILNEGLNNNTQERSFRLGIEMVVNSLDSMSDADWLNINNIDKIEMALKPVLSWYDTYRQYYGESQLYNMFCTIPNKDKTKETAHYRAVLKKLKLPIPTVDELQNIEYKLAGIEHALWGVWGISDGIKKNYFDGKGLFPNTREQMALDRKNGWDGISDFTKQRNKQIEDYLQRTLP